MALLTNINGKFSVSDAGAVTFNNAFTFPTADGTANYVLKTNGSGQLAWAADNYENYDYWTLQGDSAANVNINSTNTLKFVGGTYIDTSATWAGGSNPRKLTINHETTSRTDTTSTDAPAFGGTFEAVTSVTTNTTGHVTAIDVSTVTIPTDPGGTVKGTGTATRVAFWSASDTITSDADLYWDNTNKRLGIGTALPTTALTIRKAISPTDYGEQASMIEFKSYYTGYDTETVKSAIYSGVSSQTTLQTTRGFMSFWTADFVSGGGQSLTEKMRIESNGNVGIGTTSPRAVGSGYKGLEVSSTSSGSSLWLSGFSDTTKGYLAMDTGGLNLTAISNHSLTFGTNNSPKMTILSDGNVGIGTDSPSTKLHLGGTAPMDSIIRQDSTVSGTNWEIGERSAGKWQIFEDDTDSVVATFMSTGNVGIGETDPSGYWGQANKLVLSDSNTGLTIKSSSNGNGRLVFTDTKSATAGLFDGGMIHYDHTTDSMQLHANGAERMRIDSSGNVLISKQSANLGVVGTELRANGQSIFTANADNAVDFNRLTSDGAIALFRKDNAVIGSIGSNTTGGNPLLDIAGASGSSNIRFLTTNTERMRIDSSGSFGLGIVPKASGTAWINAQFGQATNIVSRKGASANAIYSNNFYIDSASADKRIIAGESNRLFLDGATTRFQYAGTGAANSVVSWSESMRIDSSGKVGIGTTNPTYKCVISNNGAEGLELAPGYVSGANLLQNYNRSNSQYVRADYVASTHQWYQGDTSTVNVHMDLTGSGVLTVKNDIVAFGSPSDKRLKENIKPIESALDKVSKLQGVTFDWKKSDSILDIKEDIGFIAQDVQKVVPELVRENKDGMLSMRHQGIAPILLEAIKELKAEIEELKSNKCNCNK